MLCMLITAVIVLSLNVYAEEIGKVKSLGYKGIHLGMTAKELDTLIDDDLRWGYNDTRDSAVGRDYITIRGTVADIEKDEDPTQIGCDGTGQCYSIKDIIGQLYEEKLISFVLPSPKYGANYIDSVVKPWGKFALKGLIDKYGKPTKTILPIEKVNIFSFKEGFNVPLYEWVIGGERIIFSTGADEFTYGIDIIYENIKAKKALKKLKEQGKTNF